MEPAEPYDVVVAGGRIIDPHSGTITDGDVAIRAGRIAAVGPGIAAEAGERIDVGGAYVSPGFTDLHGHFFASGFPLAVEPDRAGIDTGVTTVVDAGSTGWANFSAFRALEMARSHTRVLAFLHLCGIGLQSLASDVGELHDLRFADVDAAVRCAGEHPGEIVGIKVRLTAGVSAPPMEILRRARDAATAAGLPLMAHITDPPAALSDVYAALRPGDIVTHAFHGGQQGILAEDGRLQPWVVDARERGVLFDVGHAGSLFDVEVARAAAAVGFWPDTISTDAYRASDGTVVPDLPGLLSSYLALGMPLTTLVAAVTTTCDRILGSPLWTMPWRIGAPADLTVFELRAGDRIYTAGRLADSPESGRHVRVVRVLRDGVAHELKENP